MPKRLFLVILCFSISMLCGCNPGDVCGPEKIIDCNGDCVDGSNIDSALGDGTCDGNLNCSEFNYDDVDCSDDTETTTTTTAETTSTTSIEGTISMPIYSVVISMSILTTLVAPPLIKWAFKEKK